MRVLFLCTLNAVRSPMAEAIARTLYPENQYFSAGLSEGPLDYLAVEVMEEIDIDISGHKSRSLDSIKNMNFDLAICLSAENNEEMKKALEKCSAKVEFWHDIPNPGMIRGNRYMQLFGYREIRDKLRSKLRHKFG